MVPPEAAGRAGLGMHQQRSYRHLRTPIRLTLLVGDRPRYGGEVGMDGSAKRR